MEEIVGVIYILWLRQLKRYIRSKARIVGSLAQPLLFLFAMGFGFGPTYQKAGNGNYIQFLAPGIIAMAILFTAVFSGIEIIWDRQFGFLKETLVAPVTRLQIVFGRTLGGATVAIIQGLIIFIFCLFAGFRIENYSLLPVAVLFMFLISMLFTAVGTAIGSIVEDMQAFPLFMNFLIMPLFFFSGALFPLSGLPSALHTIVRLNPLTYGVDGLRGTLVGGFVFSIQTDIAFISLASVALLILGSYFFSKIEI
jgi:ABC-2 type transport system permease protein